MDTPQFDVHAASEEHHWWFLGRRTIVQKLLQTVVPPSKEKKIIDTGCGTGGMTAFLSTEYSCMGIDPASDAIAYATKRFPHCTFRQGMVPDDAEKELREADAVLLLEVLEHVEEDVAFVHALIERLKPGAVLLMMAPADPSLWSPHDEGFGHFRRYTEVAWRNLFKGQQVDELLVSFCNTRLYPLAKLMRTISKFRGKSWGPGQTDIALPSKPVNTILTKIFQGEADVLAKALQQKKNGYRYGVTLLAVLRKKA